jgi:hypothetical protein
MTKVSLPHVPLICLAIIGFVAMVARHGIPPIHEADHQSVVLRIKKQPENNIQREIFYTGVFVEDKQLIAT